MSHPLYPAGHPTFNHVAMSLPADLLGETGRKEIVSFWGEVFGFEEYPQMTEDGKRLVLGACHFDQFVFLIAEEEPMRCPQLDHFGMAVHSRADLDAAWERASAFAERDDRVRLIEPHVDDHEVVKIHAFYAAFLLPMMIEIQYWESAR